MNIVGSFSIHIEILFETESGTLVFFYTSFKREQRVRRGEAAILVLRLILVVGSLAFIWLGVTNVLDSYRIPTDGTYTNN